MLDSRYSPQDVEQKIYNLWIEKKCFEAKDLSTKPPFSVILPPPNVTGSLHLGHALDHTIQDVIVRWKRMSGFNALWLPGTDHAGIATQIVVERELKKEKANRQQLGREKFVERVWAWKHESGNRIVEQMKRLGNSCDWDRLTFTLDENVSKAVRKVFVQLHRDGLIYRGKKLVNWDTQLETAVSDLEVDHRETKGTLWHLQYPIEGTSEFLTIATTRPETLLGDVAVAVNPEDERYQNLVGKRVQLPLLKRTIPIIADSYVDKAFGSGVVKITPAHDFNDAEVGARHRLEPINILNSNGTLNENAGSYKGLTVLEARQKVLEDLKEQNLVLKEEPHVAMTPISDRTGTVIEPYLSFQWFVSMKNVAKPARHAVENGTVRFVPENWTKTYLHWMNNIQDWCISRQLWWGHRIPAWYCGDCEHVTVAETDTTVCSKCQSKNLHQDQDVLDTWFSSALWPFSTMGWPEETEAQKTFYPTSLLVTGHDIIFFWVARMMMMGLHFKKDVPFRDIYIHGLIRDAQGRKMSKSVGNTLDPLDLIEKHGSDALRFTLMAQIAGGRDLKFSEQRLEGYRNFINKLWNASRFSLGALAGFDETQLKALPSKKDLSFPDQWITSKLAGVEKTVHDALESYRFSDAANALYGFVWYDFCDWYLEFIKPVIYGNNVQEKQATQHVLHQTLVRILKLLHPFIPFVTEEIYQKLPATQVDGQMNMLATASYPTVLKDKEWLSIGSQEIGQKLDLVREVITAVRNIRGENRISPAIDIEIRLLVSDAEVQKILLENKDYITKLGRIKECKIEQTASMAKCAVAPVTSGTWKVDVVVPLEGLVDFDEEVKRVQKNIEKLRKEHMGIKSKLENENYIKNAPADLVEQDRDRLQVLQTQVQSLETALVRLQS